MNDDRDVARALRDAVPIPEVPTSLLVGALLSDGGVTLRLTEVEDLIERGVIGGGMLPKISGALKALKAGVRKTHIIDAALPHSLLLELFTDKGVGTEIVNDAT